MIENAYSIASDTKRQTQFSLTTLVATIPESIAYLRSGLYRIPRAVPDNTPEVKSANGPGPTVPLDISAVDAADQQLELLAYWAEVAGCDMTDLGRTWRYHKDHPVLAGFIRGVANDDPRPADRLSIRLLMAMRSGEWLEPAGMHSQLHSMMAGHATRWPAIHDLLLEAR